MPPKPIASKSSPQPASQASSESLLSRLRHEILHGDLDPGAPLRQDDIATRYGVSKIPVREALLQLVAEGLVVSQPNRGFTVSSLQPQEAEEILEIRAILEGQAIRMAMPHMAEADIACARRILDRAEATDALDSWSELNWEFHEALYVPAQRGRLLRLIRQISNPTDRYIRVLVSNANYRGRAEREHRAILAACEVGNAEAAASLLDQHIRQTGVLLAVFLKTTHIGTSSP
nr:GntR family transcriptional regulator [uncultured bacterium]